MEKRFMTTKEVAAFLCVSVRTLYNHASQHEFYRPSRPGIWHVEHVKILERVWTRAATEDEGLALWKYVLLKMRKDFKPLELGDFCNVKPCSRSIRRGQQRTSRKS